MNIGRARLNAKRAYVPPVVKMPDPTGRHCAHMEPKKKGDQTICGPCLAPMNPRRSTFDAILARSTNH